MWNMMKPLLFSLPPETAHALVLNLVKVLGWSKVARSIVKKIYSIQDKPVELWGLKFKNRVGLAAGWDKDGVAIKGLAALGFGHIEVGTVTPLPQRGNPKPRIFRLDEDETLINRMGFPSQGEDELAMRLLYLKFKRGIDPVLGVNIGKNSATPNENAHEEYCGLLKRVSHLTDYIVLNLSSPNTEGLRDLQARNALEQLLENIRRTRQELSSTHRYTPVLVKLSPDLTLAQLEDAVGVSLDKGMDGVIAANTTISRSNLSSSKKFEVGGASGRVLIESSREILRRVVHQVDGRVPVISSGGIMSAAEGRLRVDMGASLVQLYTGLIYRGPRLIGQINDLL
jgi:dihydroorotate dehydrogenase